MKRNRDNEVNINIGNLPSDILLGIFTSIKHDLPWKTLHCIFNNYKMVNSEWRTIITSNEKVICTALEIPFLHFVSAMNREDEIVRLFLDENHGLRAPDKRGYSPASYAVGNHAHKSMRILKIGYALGTEFISGRELLKISQNDPVSKQLLNEISDGISTLPNFEDAIEEQSIESIKKVLMLSTISHYGENYTISKKLFKYHIKLIRSKLLDDNSINRLIMYAYKNYLIKQFWDSPTEKILKLCLEYNVDCNTCDEKGNTFLHIIVRYVNLLPIVKLLLDCKNINVNVKNLKLKTPLTLAIMHKNTDIAKYIMEKSDIIYDRDCGECMICADLPDCLELAILNGYQPTTDDVLSAIEMNENKYYMSKCLQIILNAININTLTKDGFPVIGYYIAKDDVDIVKFLIKNGASLLIRDSTSTSLIELAIESNSEKCLAVLFDHLNGDINKISETTGYTPLGIASILGKIECINVIIKYGAQINLRDKYGRTALHHIIRENTNIDCAITLINAGININAKIKNNNGNKFTALHIACVFGEYNIIKLLLKHGADKTLKTKSGLSALDIAINNKMVDHSIEKVYSKIMDILQT